MSTGRKKLYDADTFPLLVEGYARNGLFDKQIAKNLGISKDTFYQYLKEFSDFSDGLKRGRHPVDIEVENALYKRAIGFEFDEKTTELEIDKDGQAKPARIKTTKKYIPGDVGAITFWLRNRKRSEWRDRHDIDFGDAKGLFNITINGKKPVDF